MSDPSPDAAPSDFGFTFRFTLCRSEPHPLHLRSARDARAESPELALLRCGLAARTLESGVAQQLDSVRSCVGQRSTALAPSRLLMSGAWLPSPPTEPSCADLRPAGRGPIMSGKIVVPDVAELGRAIHRLPRRRADRAALTSRFLAAFLAVHDPTSGPPWHGGHVGGETIRRVPWQPWRQVLL